MPALPAGYETAAVLLDAHQGAVDAQTGALLPHLQGRSVTHNCLASMITADLRLWRTW